MKKNPAYLQVVLVSTTCTGDDRIRILDFLAQAELLDMNERKAYVTLPKFLGKRAAQQFSDARAGSTQSEGISSRPSAVNFLLRAYATDENIRRAVEALRAVHQRDRGNRGRLPPFALKPRTRGAEIIYPRGS